MTSTILLKNGNYYYTKNKESSYSEFFIFLVIQQFF